MLHHGIAQSISSFYPSQLEVVQEARHYRVIFPIATAPNSVQINIHISPQFPFAPPTMLVSPPMAHPWLDKEGRLVGHPHLLAWHQSHSIGKILKDLEIEFSLRPPVPVSTKARPSLKQVDLDIIDAKTYNFSTHFLRMDELREINKDELMFENFVMALETPKDLLKPKIDVMRETAETANENLQLLAGIQRLKDELCLARTEISEKEQKLDSILQANPNSARFLSLAQMESKIGAAIDSASSYNLSCNSSGIEKDLDEFVNSRQAVHRFNILRQKLLEAASTSQ